MKVLDAELDRRRKLRDHYHAAGFTTSALHAAENVVAFEEAMQIIKELLDASKRFTYGSDRLAIAHNKATELML